MYLGIATAISSIPIAFGYPIETPEVVGQVREIDSQISENSLRGVNLENLMYLSSTNPELEEERLLQTAYEKRLQLLE